MDRWLARSGTYGLILMRKRIAHILIVLVLFSCLSAIPNSTEQNMEAYLFTYFTGNRVEDESIHFAVSADGYNYHALNQNRPILDSKKISSTGGVRDPHILRGKDGKSFYMVVTDMTSHKGWDSNRAIVLLKSKNLVDWESSVVNIQNRFQGHDDLKRVWAPQTIYDEKAHKYMVYFSMKHGDGPDIIYYAYSNEDFTDLEHEPKQLFFPQNGKSCIDGDIVKKDGVYHLFYKTEGHGNGIKHATTTKLTSGQWEEEDDYKQQTSESVEGSSIFKLNDSDQYILLYDVYMQGSYQFTRSSDLKKFEVIDDQITMDFHPRHGTVLPITQDELNQLFKKWGEPKEYNEIKKVK